MAGAPERGHEFRRLRRLDRRRTLVLIFGAAAILHGPNGRRRCRAWISGRARLDFRDRRRRRRGQSHRHAVRRARCALPGLALRDGVPEALRTIVAVPTLLTTQDDIAELVERLEIHHLASPEGDLHFALLSDWTDADVESAEGDAALVRVLRAKRHRSPQPALRPRARRARASCCCIAGASGAKASSAGSAGSASAASFTS